MALPTLADLKVHLRIRHGLEDADLQMKLDAAIDSASTFLNRPIPWPEAEPQDPGDPVFAEVPKAVSAAIMIMASELYANREQSVVGTIYSPIPTAERLLWPHRVGLGV